MEKIRTGRQPCRISDTGGYFRAVSGTLLSHGDSGNSFEWTYIYRYDNYGEKEWLEVGTTCGYA